MTQPIIALENLTKTFRVALKPEGRSLPWARTWKTVTAVDAISLAIGRGEVVGYLGPNGAGKSTTIKMMTGILTPTAGTLRVAGRVPWRERRQHVAGIGVVFGQRNTLWWDLPVQESLDLLRHVYRVPPARFAENLTRFRALLDLDEFRFKPARDLSLGQLMRANLAAALMHDPGLLFLDEPTIGLDVVAKDRIRAFIREINRERGVTVLLTTHDLSDIEQLCERVIVIDHGRTRYDGALSELVERYGGDRALQVDFADDYAEVAVEGATLESREGRRAVFRFGRGVTAAALIGRLSERYTLADLTVREPDIEDTLRRMY
ncbi:MAG: ATP-binding cassette domain-containing protein [Thermoflexales bacterium]|nr:ATP-binding cassette domain-containing protein [Thermoflexales bacterium]